MSNWTNDPVYTVRSALTFPSHSLCHRLVLVKKFQKRTTWLVTLQSLYSLIAKTTMMVICEQSALERKGWQHTCSGLYIRTMDKHRWTRYLLIHCSRLSILDGTSLLPTHQHDIYITRPVHSPSMGPHRLYWWWQIRKKMFNIRLRNWHYFMNPLPARNRCIVQIFHTRPHTTPIQIHGNLSTV